MKQNAEKAGIFTVHRWHHCQSAKQPNTRTMLIYLRELIRFDPIGNYISCVSIETKQNA